MKKAQITVFIIMGFLILLAGIAIFYFTRESVKSDLSSEVEKAQDLPLWAAEVKPYVDKCIQDLSIKAFNKIGEHGGYIDLNDSYLTPSVLSLNPSDPTEADAVAISDKPASSIAYWWYMQTQNTCDDCIVSSNDPPIDMIEWQVARYVDRQLPDCLQNFTVLNGISVKRGSINSTVTINEKDVDVQVLMPTQISNVDMSASIEKYKITLPLDFNHAYLAAALIANHEISERFLEGIVNHIITISSFQDQDKLPPISAIDSKNGRTTWRKSEVKRRIVDDVLLSRIPALQIKNTKTYTQLSSQDPLTQGLNDIMALDILPEGYENLEVSFIYNPDWNIFFDITPSSGEVLGPLTTRTDDTGIGFFPQSVNNFYEFYYDLSFPVLVMIKDPDSLKDQQGYQFIFALEANIRDNKDLYQWNHGNGTIGQADYRRVSLAAKSSQVDAKACEQEGSKWRCPLDDQVYSDMPKCIDKCKTSTQQTKDMTLLPSLFCDSNQRISGNITVNAYDAKTLLPLPGVQLTFGCGNYRKCPMEGTDSQGTYISRFPVCIGDGYIRAEKEGYMPEYEGGVSISPETKTRYDIYLEPIRTKKIEAAYINITNIYRIKNTLHPKTGESMLDELYYKKFETAQGAQITIHQGILGEIYYKVDDKEKRTVLLKARAIENARDLLKDIEYHQEAKKEPVVDVFFSVKEAAEFAGARSDLLSFVSKSKVDSYIDWFKKEENNIQFRSDTYFSSVIGMARSQANSLKDKQVLTITYQKAKEKPYEQNMPSSIAQLGNFNTTISLVPGIYNLNMMFRDDQGYVIPAKDGYSEFNYTPAILGGAQLDEKTSQWVIDKERLDASSTIKFYFFKIDNPTSLEDTGEIGSIVNYSIDYRPYIEPEFLP